MRYVLDHWPEVLFVALMIVGGISAGFVPVSPVLRFALIPVGWVAGFAVWIAVVTAVFWLRSRKSS